MVYGYARVSTMGQARDGNSMEAQVCALKLAEAVKIFKDVFSGKSEHRPHLEGHRERVQTHHYEAGSHSPQSHSRSAVARDA